MKPNERIGRAIGAGLGVFTLLVGAFVGAGAGIGFVVYAAGQLPAPWSAVAIGALIVAGAAALGVTTSVWKSGDPS